MRNSTNTKGKYSALAGCTLMLSIVYMSLTSWSIAVNELADAFNLSTSLIQAGSSMLIAGYAFRYREYGAYASAYPPPVPYWLVRCR